MLKLKQSWLFVLFLFFWNSNASFAQEVQLHTVAIVVKNMKESVSWYEKVLDLAVIKEMNFPEYDSLQISFLKNKYFQLELMSKSTSFSINNYVENYSINQRPLLGLSKFAVKVEQLEKRFELLQELNAEVVLPITEDEAFNIRYFIVSDPNGVIIQFIEEKR